MKSPKTFLILFLALTTFGGAALAWRQYAELVELRAIAMNHEERADYQKRIWDLEKANRELQGRLAGIRPDGGMESMLAAATAEGAAESSGRGSRGEEGRWGRGGGPPPQFAAVRELMNKPEVQAMIAAQQRSALEARYAALFKNLNLSPEQAGKLTTLLAERQASRQDVFEVARAQGIDPRENPESFRKLMTDTRNEVDASIKSAIGEEGFAQLQNYERTLPQRSVVNELQERLSYSNPLTPTQAEQLVQILAANTPQRTTSQTGSGVPQSPPSSGRGDSGFIVRRPDFGGRGPDLGMLAGAFGGGGLIGATIDGGRGSGSAPITSTAVNHAQAVLSQPQMAVLQQLQQQQQTQQQLSQLIRETVSANQPTASRRSNSAPQTGAGSPPASNQPRRSRPGGGG